MKKKNTIIRRTLALMLALIMMVAMSATVLAEGTTETVQTGRITVTSANPEFNGKEVSAIQIFSATVSGEKPSQAVAYTLNSKFEKFFTNGDQVDDPYNCKGKSGTELSEAAYKYVLGLKGEEKAPDLADFSAAVLKFAKEEKCQLDKVATAQPINGTYVATLENLSYGYYLVYPQSGSTSSTTHTDAHLVSLTETVQEIGLKSEYPTIEKKITDGSVTTDTKDVNIGDSVTFTLASKVPDMTEYKQYTFKFIDILSKGLTLNSESIKVTVGDTTLTNNTTDTSGATNGFKIKEDPNTQEGTNTLTIELINFKGNFEKQAGDKIVVQYTAILNKDAVIGEAGNTNKAWVEYSNNPADETLTDKSTEDEVKTFTFDFKIDKYTGETYNENATRLADAVFEIRKSKDKNSEINFIEENPGGATESAVYYVVSNTTTDPTAVKRLKTPASGKIQIKGLATGTYYLYEIEAPAGYNKLAEPIQVVNSLNKDATTGNITGVTVKYGTENAVENDLNTANNGVIPVQNNSGTILPSTGGLGTLILAICGAGLVIFGLVRRNRKLKGTL